MALRSILPIDRLGFALLTLAAIVTQLVSLRSETIAHAGLVDTAIPWVNSVAHERMPIVDVADFRWCGSPTS